MEVEYVSDLNNNYLTIPYDQTENQLEFMMLLKNRIPGCLKMEIRHMNGRKILYYAVSRLQNLQTLFAARKMTFYQFEELMEGLALLEEILPEYYLQRCMVMLEPEYIFYDMELHKFCFLVVPLKMNAKNTIDILDCGLLAEYIVTIIDHKDEKLTEAAYQFYEEATQGEVLLKKYYQNENKQERIVINEKSVEVEAVEESMPDGEEIGEECGEPIGETEKKYLDWRGASWLALTLLALLAVGLYLFRMSHNIKYIVYFGILGMLSTMVYVILQVRKNRKINQQNNADLELENIRKLQNDYDLFEENMEMQSVVCENTVYMEVNVEKENKLYGTGKNRKCKISIDHFPLTIGKDDAFCDAVLADSSVSRLHARFSLEDDRVMLMDLNSLNGTIVNGLRLRPNQKVEIESEDEISFGGAEFVFR